MAGRTYGRRPIVGLTLVSLLTGCAPAVILERPQEWPEQWAERSLYNTPNAYIYAAGDAAAGEADRLVEQCANLFEAKHGRRPAKGLVVVSDRNDGLFTKDARSLMVIAAKGGAKRDADLAKVEEDVNEVWFEYELTIGALGCDPALVHRMAPLPLHRADVGRIVALSEEDRDRFGWAISLPTKSAMRKAVHTACSRALDTMDIGLAARLAVAPFMPFAEAKAVEEISNQCVEMTCGVMCLTDPELPEPEEPIFEFSGGDKGGVTIGEKVDPASGLKKGDKIISIDGKPVRGLRSFVAGLAGKKKGETVEMVVVRDGDEQTITVTMTRDH
jgi:hypothetical protein